MEKDKKIERFTGLVLAYSKIVAIPQYLDIDWDKVETKKKRLLKKCLKMKREIDYDN